MSSKVYVDVDVEFSSDGKMMPKWIRWTDGHIFMIDRVKQCVRAASRKAGGAGLRYGEHPWGGEKVFVSGFSYLQRHKQKERAADEVLTVVQDISIFEERMAEGTARNLPFDTISGADSRCLLPMGVIMRKDWNYHRGDVYLADCGEWHGSIQGGIRPVVVMQNDIGNKHSPTICIVKLTTKTDKKPGQPTHHLLKGVRGLPCNSQVLAEQVDTINKTDIIRYMAHLSDKEMEAIGRCVLIEMGMLMTTGNMAGSKEGGAAHDTGTDA